MALGKTEVQLTILFALKATYVKLRQAISHSSNILWHWESIWYYLETWHPARLAYKICILKVIYLTSLKTSRVVENSLYGYSILFQTNTNRKQEFLKAVLSTTLFIVKTNSISDYLPVHIEKFLYVYDFVLCYSSNNMDMIERKLQQALNKLDHWANIPTASSFLKKKNKNYSLL